MPPEDGALAAGITDAASIVLQHNSTTVDALCFYYDPTTLSTISGYSTCEGAPVVNPHNSANTTNVDASIERRPGGALGNAQDTGDDSADFQTATPAEPRNSASPPFP
jgi:hypothetical protein